MRQPLVITISHSLGKEEATSRLKSGLAHATASIPMLSVDEEVWSGDRMDFRMTALGSQASGNVQVTDNDVRFEIALPWLLQTFAEKIQGAITARSQALLEKK